MIFGQTLWFSVVIRHLCLLSCIFAINFINSEKRPCVSAPPSTPYILLISNDIMMSVDVFTPHPPWDTPSVHPWVAMTLVKCISFHMQNGSRALSRHTSWKRVKGPFRMRSLLELHKILCLRPWIFSQPCKGPLIHAVFSEWNPSFCAWFYLRSRDLLHWQNILNSWNFPQPLAVCASWLCPLWGCLGGHPEILATAFSMSDC